MQPTVLSGFPVYFTAAAARGLHGAFLNFTWLYLITIWPFSQDYVSILHKRPPILAFFPYSKDPICIFVAFFPSACAKKPRLTVFRRRRGIEYRSYLILRY